MFASICTILDDLKELLICLLTNNFKKSLVSEPILVFFVFFRFFFVSCIFCCRTAAASLRMSQWDFNASPETQPSLGIFVLKLGASNLVHLLNIGSLSLIEFQFIFIRLFLKQMYVAVFGSSSPSRYTCLRFVPYTCLSAECCELLQVFTLVA